MATDAILEKKLIEIRKKLSPSPSEQSDVKPLALLNELDLFLSKIRQSPPHPIARAIEPIMEQLTTKTYLKHLNKDVKLAVASCLSQITRITAPDVPFDDNVTKDIFQLIIEAFKDIHDLSSPFNQRRISILDICAKIRSSVILLDLECDDMVHDMFHHFMKNLRSDHPEIVFTSMENIMTIIIKESEYIMPELLSDLLDTLNLDNMDILPVTRRLARKVMANTADKIRPCLMRLVDLNRINLSEYNEVVAAICQGGSAALIDMEKNSKLSDSTISDELQQANTKGDHEVASPEKLTTASNGDIRNANSISSKVDSESAVANQENLKANSSAEKVAPVTHIDSNNEDDSQKKTDTVQDDEDNTYITAMDVDSEKKHDNTNKSKLNSSGRKSQHKKRVKLTPLKGDESKEIEDACDVNNQSMVGSRIEVWWPDDQEFYSGVVESYDPDTKKHKVVYDDGEIEILWLKDERYNIDGSEEVKTMDNQDSSSELGSTSKGKGDNKLSESTVSDELPEVFTKGDTEVAFPEKFISTSSHRNANSKSSKVSSKSAAAKQDGASNNNRSKSLKPNSLTKKATPVIHIDSNYEEDYCKKIDTVQDDEGVNAVNVDSEKKHYNTDKSKPSSSKGKSLNKGRARSKVSVTTTNGTLDSKETPLKAECKEDEDATDEDEANVLKLSETIPQPISSKRKGEVRRKAQPKTSKEQNASKLAEIIDDVLVHKENKILVGSKIAVWWPDDQEFYSGVVESYDPDTKKHKIVYDDGETEILTLKDERYKLDESGTKKILDTPQKVENINNASDNDSTTNLPEGEEESNSSKRGQLKRKFSEKHLFNNKGKSTPNKQKKNDSCDASVHKKKQSFVGSKIEVWWPDDQEFYSGVVESYDPDTKKHKITYDDGEIEFLTLKDERYKLNGSEVEKNTDNEKDEGSSSKKSEGKTSSSTSRFNGNSGNQSKAEGDEADAGKKRMSLVN